MSCTKLPETQRRSTAAILFCRVFIVPSQIPVRGSSRRTLSGAHLPKEKPNGPTLVANPAFPVLRTSLDGFAIRR